MSPDMTTQTLCDLAEAGAPTVAPRPFLAERVLALGRASRRRRRIGTSLALAGLVAGGTVAARSSGESRFYSVDEPSNSMAPTLVVSEHLVLDRTLAPSRGDLVELHASYAGERFTTIRRIVGLPGDVIACPAASDGHCHGWTRNGLLLSEAYIDRGDGIAPYAAITVTAGKCFVLGDNRDNAVDSRMYGLATLSGVDGVGVQVVGTDGRGRPIPGAPPHEAPGPGGTIDPPGTLPTSAAQPVVTAPAG